MTYTSLAGEYLTVTVNEAKYNFSLEWLQKANLEFVFETDKIANFVPS